MLKLCAILFLLVTTSFRCSNSDENKLLVPDELPDDLPNYQNQVPESIQSMHSEEITYLISDSTITLLTPVCECHDTLLKKGSRPDAFTFTLRDDSLFVNTGVFQVGSDSNSIVTTRSLFIRKSGLGLRGTWEMSNVLYSSSGLKYNPDSLLIPKAIDEKTRKLGQWLFIDNSSLVLYYGVVKKDREPFTETFITQYASMIDSTIKINIETISTDTVNLFGSKSMDTVVIAQQPNGDLIYTSNNKLFTTYTWYFKTTKCPNELYPSWLLEKFIHNNKL